MRTFPRAQHVVSTIICWCFHASSVSGDFGARHDGFFAEQALQPAYEPYRHIGTLPRSSGLPSPSEFSPSYRKLGTGMLARRHSRRSQQEIKCYLWCAGHCLTLVNWPPKTKSTEPFTQDASSEVSHRIGHPITGHSQRPSACLKGAMNKSSGWVAQILAYGHYARVGTARSPWHRLDQPADPDGGFRRRNRRPIPAPVGNKANPMLGSTIDIFPLGW